MTTPLRSRADLHADLARALRDHLHQRSITLAQAEIAEARRRYTREEWREIRATLAQSVVADPDRLDAYAAWALAARAGHPLRLLLIGPPGVGKSHTARAIADAIGSHRVAASITEVTEAGWAGIHLSEIIQAAGAWLTAGGTLVLDEIDKAAARPGLNETSRAKYTGQMAVLLTLLDRAGSVLLDGGHPIRSENIHVILTGAFSDSAWAGTGHTPTRADLRRYGIAAEVLDRIDHIIMVAPPPPAMLATIAGGSLDEDHGLLGVARTLGYEIQIPPAALAYAARLHSHGPTAGTRTTRAALEAAVLRVLARAIQDGHGGSVLTVTPDDVPRPPPQILRPGRGIGDGDSPWATIG